MITLIMSMLLIPYFRDPVSVFADSGSGSVGTDWNRVTTNDQMVQSFLAYCKSRDSNIVGGTANAVSNFTYSMMQQLSKSVGIDLNELQSELYYKQENNQGIQWFMTATGIQAYNSLFARLISENGFEVGESADKTLYSGKSFIDADNYFCLVYIQPSTTTNSSNLSDVCTYLGTPYHFDTTSWGYGQNATSGTFHYTSTQSESYNLFYYGQGDFYYLAYTQNGYSRQDLNTYVFKSGQFSYNSWLGNPAIIYRESNGKLYSGYYRYRPDGTSYYLYPRTEIKSAQDLGDVNITFISNNIKQEYQGDTYITNEGDQITNEGDTIYNPYPDGGGTTSPPTNTGGGSGADDTEVTFPNFDFQLPEIDWSLGDLSEKFPFSIPFDLVAFFTVMNAEPQAPQIDANIPLGSWYTWRFQADFSQFDNYAVIIRNVEFIAFCIGLIYLTIRLTKG